MRKLLGTLPLYWRIFATQFVVLTVAFLLLVFAPVTVSIPVAATELVVLICGLAALVALSLLLLRPALRPLETVTTTMRSIDPLRPGQRVPVVGEPDFAALAQAFNDMLERLERERRDSARRALAVQEGERRRVARELHDEVGQVFTAIMLQIEHLTAAVPPELREELEELRETARVGAYDVRRIAARLRPQVLDDLGLHSALKALATAHADQAGVHVERALEPISLDEERELVAYRVAQEALTNVARHAGARRVSLSLRREDGSAVLRVRDDGRGMPPGAASSSNGIRGMRERALLIGATLIVRNAEGGGTEVVLRIPGVP
ncbi:HAMP domain-containing sensor histidine kinase [Conexibacter arvalis]|uniref:histidine kinase n=1 Tax=Conexibacter arvalis TaxID=912552 RepID=A0A840IBN9_9ACTN|nr:HAMP domain-containing sensor histidine kinase [Conexibacter arvalis]MBB4662309.1 two-component system sensor histidine kinase UhpB [Conexibacter arvalis]